MKESSEQLLVMRKKIFFLVSASIFLVALGMGYTIGYITKPSKEIYIQQNLENEKTVLTFKPQTQSETQPQPSQEVKIVQEVEAKEKNSVASDRQSLERKKVTHEKKYKGSRYTLQFGAFSEKSNAEKLLQKLKKEKINVYIVKEGYYKVRAGYYKSFKEASEASERLRSKGIESFVKKIK